ncbi:MAG: class I SAM-dependent methyltransferase [Candidatus Heimdallarchaeota archaeon]|nr:class I SAM-dependent methyltransferase [Candidatus Heimdallarchaeota archaeon]
MGVEKRKEAFQGITLVVEDLYLLEPFQIGNLKQYAPKRELAAVLHEYNDIRRFLIAKNQDISPFLTEIMTEYGSARDQNQLTEFVDILVWTLGYMLIQNKHPEEMNLRGMAGYWDLDEISSITPLKDKTVIDVGAGAGNITFTVVKESGVVFAVEPVNSLREFMRKKAGQDGIDNLFVLDGFLHEIPLPRDSVDVLITSNAIGFGDLEKELKEIERIVKPQGYAIHLRIHKTKSGVESIHQTLTSSTWNYQFEEIDLSEFKLNTFKIKYWKQI